jgi:phosphohistidine phosphatase
LTPQESAAKEAWEEAGVEGTVSAEPLGLYRYAKWGATCTVEVFSMEVTGVLDEAVWEERHRGRSWVTPEQAAEGLKQRELAPMVERLAAGLSADQE